VSVQLKIGDLAKRAQCPAETIRYYEREGLLPEPTRTAGNYRLYSRAHLERLAFIRNCRSLDMTLEEIRQLLRVRDVPGENCDAAHRLLDEHIAHVATRVAELQQLERQLKALRRQCAPARLEKNCAILDGLGRRATAGTPKKSGLHVRGTHRG
jgi:Cd(II)/Pb(II)-responsive transcriptional regulator